MVTVQWKRKGKIRDAALIDECVMLPFSPPYVGEVLPFFLCCLQPPYTLSLPSFFMAQIQQVAVKHSSRDSGPYWHDGITQLLQIRWLHVHESPVLSHPKGSIIDWKLVILEAIWAQWTCRVQEVWDDLTFGTWRVILLEAAIRIWVHCGHKRMDMFCNINSV